MIRCLLILLLVFSVPVPAQPRPGENAALRYWSAFALMQQETITPEKAKELSAIQDGSAPYDDLKYRDLVERNRQALVTLDRATTLPFCDWGIDYTLGSEAPIDYARKALALGRLNVLSVFHLLQNGQRAAAIERLSSGLRFSRHVAAGGPLFAALAAKSLMVNHLRGIEFAQAARPLDAGEKARLLGAVENVGIDWAGAMRVEFDAVFRPATGDSKALSSLYVQTLADSSQLDKLERWIAGLPRAMSSRVPNPRRVAGEKGDLAGHVQRVRKLLSPAG